MTSFLALNCPTLSCYPSPSDHFFDKRIIALVPSDVAYILVGIAHGGFGDFLLICTYLSDLKIVFCQRFCLFN